MLETSADELCSCIMAAMGKDKKDRKLAILDAATVLICLVLPSALLIPWDSLSGATDFPNYYCAAKMLLQGQAGIAYDAVKLGAYENELLPALKGRIMPFLLFPVLAWIVSPLGLLPYGVAFVVWTVLLYGCLCAAFFIFARVFDLSRRERLWAAALLGASGPCLEAIRVGQLSCVLLLGLAGVAYGIKYRSLMPAGLSQAILWLKPHLLLPILLYEFGKKLWQLPAVTLSVGAASGLIALAVIGIPAMQEYFDSVSTPDFQQTYMGIAAAPTLRAQIMKLAPAAHIDGLVFVVYTVVAILAGLAGLLLRRDFLFTLFAVVLPAVLAFSPHLHNYDLILLFPGLLLMIRTPAAPRALRICGGLMIVLLAIPVYLAVHYFYVLQLGLFNPFFIGMVVCAIVSLLRAPAASE
jgi:alpha-1,2-mannosyltransferase